MSKKFRGLGLYPRTPVKRGRGGKRERRGEEGAREGRPPIHIPGYATEHNVPIAQAQMQRGESGRQ